MMGKIRNWFRNKMTGLMLAVSSVEKSALSQTGELMSTDINKHQRYSQGRLSDALINGEVTEEVLNLKWRTYKILKAAEGVRAEIIGYDEDNLPITRIVRIDNKRALKKVKVDDFDDYPLEMVINNDDISTGTNDAMGNEYITPNEKPILSTAEDGEISAAHGAMSGEEYFASNKSQKPIVILRDEAPTFYIEHFTKKLNIRRISETERLLEFYVSKYPDEYNRTSRLFISSVKKHMESNNLPAMCKIDGVEFVTYKSLGVYDFLEFKYDIVSYDKTIEFNGHYVIKFIAKIDVNGRDIMEEHKVDELDKKYENKEKK